MRLDLTFMIILLVILKTTSLMVHAMETPTWARQRQLDGRVSRSPGVAQNFRTSSYCFEFVEFDDNVLCWCGRGIPKISAVVK